MRNIALVLFLACSAASAAGCGGAGANANARTPLAEKWFVRAQNSYRAGDFEDAATSAESALQAAPHDPEVKLVNARIALARLEYAKAVKLTEGIETSDALGVRGRAHWYAGDLDAAADDLEAMLRDPAVKDPWAVEIAKLARRGSGRHPFAMDGSFVGEVDMPRAGAALVVPCEIEGEQVLALIATASGEVILDSNSRREPAWVNMGFGGVEVRDVPALTQDLSPLSRQLGAPIKALIGVNLLRHVHATFDRHGDQFVVRRGDPPAPPDASRVPLWYVRGGGMLMKATVTNKEGGDAMLLVDSSQSFLLALNDPIWKKAGVDVKTLQPAQDMPSVKAGALPMFRLGGFDLPMVPAVQGLELSKVQQTLDVDLGGVVGAGLISAFRVTFGDEGRYIWMEPDPMMAGAGRGAAPPRSEPPPGAGSPAIPPLLPGPLTGGGGKLIMPAPDTTPGSAPASAPSKPAPPPPPPAKKVPAGAGPVPPPPPASGAKP